MSSFHTTVSPFVWAILKTEIFSRGLYFKVAICDFDEF